MEEFVRDNIKLGEGNLANREEGKDLILPNVDHICRKHKNIEWNHTGIHVDSEKEIQ